jgi:NodT family efflux transporter outer membrane factor (OMF) lipoprotein
LNKRLILALCFLALSACTSAEPYRSSGIPAPGLWTRLTGLGRQAPVALDVNGPVEQQWWAHFNDPALDRLIADALQGNKTLQIAQARVTEARADRKASIATLLPQVSGAADATRENYGFLYNKPIGILDASLQSTWELDLFGKNQARAAAAQANLQALEADRQAATVSLLANVARTYFDYRNDTRQIALTEQNLADQKRTLGVTKEQYNSGEVTDLDVERAVTQTESTEAELPSLEAIRDADLNELSILTGKTPGTVDASLRNLPPPAPLDNKILVAAPARVLAARPDVRAAERNFAAAVSLRKAAFRELFPTISLTAMYGVQDTSVVLARPWTLATGLTQPILNFGAIRAQIDAAKARQREAFLNYQETVLEALQDMENALSSYGRETERNASLRRSVNAADKAQRIAREQYRAGSVNLLDVLIAQRDALNAEAALATSDAQLREDLVHIYTAAGGGWTAEVSGTDASSH